MTNAMKTGTFGEFGTASGTRVQFDSIQEPGAYICNWSGHLLRIPDDAVAPGRSPLVNVIGLEPPFVTKLTDNPFVTLTKAVLFVLTGPARGRHLVPTSC